MPAIFISHSSADRDAAAQICAELDKLSYEKVFLDFDAERGIPIGENWEKTLYENIARCHAMILVLTRNWLSSTWCQVEFRQARALGKLVLPIVCSPLGGAQVLPEIQAADFMEWANGGAQRLERSLHAITEELARGFSLPAGRPPYPGIYAFEAEDAAIFFGRDDETRAVIEKLNARRTLGGSRLLLIIGASGSGKSSLLKAGVLPQIRRARREWLPLSPMRPERAPLETLAKEIAEHLGDPQGWRTWHDNLKTPEGLRRLEDAVRDLRVGDSRNATLLLPFDQFEELFTIADADERTDFMRALSAILDPGRGWPVVAVATGRADVLQGLLEKSDLAKLIETTTLSPMPLDRVPQLVSGPAGVASIFVTNGLPEQIARDVESPDALPLLAYMLEKLYQLCRTERRFTLAAYRSLGDPVRGLTPVQNAVRLGADRAVDLTPPATPEEMLALRDAFVPYLVRVRLDDGRRVRRPAPLAELPRASERLVNALVAARLLTVRTQDGETLVEVAHEALFAAWPTLAAWLDEEYAFLSDIERLKDAHESWRQAPAAHKPQALLSGLLLAHARDWLLKHPTRFVGSEGDALRAFVVESAAAADAEQARVAAQEERARRIERWLLRGAVGAAIVFAAATAVAGWQYVQAETARERANNERKVAVAREIFALSQAEERTNNECSLTLSVAAYDAARQATGVALQPFESEVRSALARTRVVATLAGRQDLPGALSWHGESGELTFVDDAGTLQNVRSPSAAPERILPDVKDVLGLEWHADGERVAVLFPGKIEIWNVTTRRLLRTIPVSDDFLFAFRWDKDGKLAMVWARSTGSLLVDTESGEINRLSGTTNIWRGYAWSPDSKRAAVAADDHTVILIDFTEKTIQRLTHPSDIITSLAWHPSENLLAVGLDSGRIWLWNLDDNTHKETLDSHTNQVTSVDFSPDGRYLASGSWDQSIRIWDMETRRSKDRLTAHNAAVRSVRWDPKGSLLASLAEDGTMRFWSPLKPRSPEILLQTPGWIWAVNWSGDGSLFAAAADTEVLVRQGSEAPRQLVQARTQIVSGAWSAAGTKYAYLDGKRIVIGDALTGENTFERTVNAGRLFAVAQSPDGKLLATVTQGGLLLFDIEKGDLLGTMQILGFSLAFSPDGSTLAVGSVLDKTVVVIDVKTRTVKTSLPAPDQQTEMWGVAWSHDGKHVAAAANDSVVYVWNANGGVPPQRLLGHGAEVKGVAWNPADDRLASASLDGTVRIWEMPSGRPLATLTGHTSGVRSVAWSRDGTSIATGAEDGTARLFLVDFAKVLGLSREQSKSGLLQSERERCLRSVTPETAR